MCITLNMTFSKNVLLNKHFISFYQKDLILYILISVGWMQSLRNAFEPLSGHR